MTRYLPILAMACATPASTATAACEELVLAFFDKVKSGEVVTTSIDITDCELPARSVESSGWYFKNKRSGMVRIDSSHAVTINIDHPDSVENVGPVLRSAVFDPSPGVYTVLVTNTGNKPQDLRVEMRLRP